MLRSPPGQRDTVRSVPKALVAAVVTVSVIGEFRSGSDRRIHHPSGPRRWPWVARRLHDPCRGFAGGLPYVVFVQTTQPEMITIRYATFDFRRYFGNNRDRGDDRSSAVRPVRPGNLGRIHAADLSSLFSPRATILIASSGNGRCSALASFHGARIQTSRSPSVSRMTGIALG